MILSRRGFLGTGLAVICAPAIVRASSLMPGNGVTIGTIRHGYFGKLAGERIMQGQLVAWMPGDPTVWRLGIGSADSDINAVKRAACFAGRPEFGVAIKAVEAGQPIQVWETAEQVKAGMPWKPSPLHQRHRFPAPLADSRNGSPNYANQAALPVAEFFL